MAKSILNLKTGSLDSNNTCTSEVLLAKISIVFSKHMSLLFSSNCVALSFFWVMRSLGGFSINHPTKIRVRSPSSENTYRRFMRLSIKILVLAAGIKLMYS